MHWRVRARPHACLCELGVVQPEIVQTALVLPLGTRVVIVVISTLCQGVGAVHPRISQLVVCFADRVDAIGTDKTNSEHARCNEHARRDTARSRIRVKRMECLLLHLVEYVTKTGVLVQISIE